MREMSETGNLLKAYDVMTPEIRFVDKSTSIKEAATRMINEGIGALIVTENNGPIGIITKRDIIWAVLFQKRDPEIDTVESIMSTPIITVDSNASIKTVIEIMMKNNISHLPVREGNKIIGMISDYDLIEILGELLDRLSIGERSSSY